MYSFRKQQVFADDYIENQFYDFFILRQNGLNKDSLKFQEEEVQAIDFVNISKLNELSKNDNFVDRKEIIDVLSEYIFRI